MTTGSGVPNFRGGRGGGDGGTATVLMTSRRRGMIHEKRARRRRRRQLTTVVLRFFVSSYASEAMRPRYRNQTRSQPVLRRPNGGRRALKR